MRRKLVLAMLAVVAIAIGISAVATRRVTHSEIRKIMFVRGGPPLTTRETAEETGLDRRLVVPFAAATALAILLALLLARRITRPVEGLTRAVEAMARGDRPEHVHVPGNDEIAQLARSFNAMADSLTEQQELRKRMVGDVAHELRTPLTNLRCELEAVQDGLASANAASLHEEVMHLSRLVDDLQEMAIADAGGLQLHREDIDLTKTICSALEPFRGEAERRAITLAMHSQPVTANADPVRVRQIMRNLLSNAMAHTADRGRIDVAAEGGGAPHVSVSNSGNPIPEGDLERIFERLYRVDEARSRNNGGAGLGLAIVKRLVEMHGGRVWAENTPDGVRFTFTLSS